jgi:hypothetical protein
MGSEMDFVSRAKTKRSECKATDGEHTCTLKKDHEPNPFLGHIDHDAGVGFTVSGDSLSGPPGFEDLP